MRCENNPASDRSGGFGGIGGRLTRIRLERNLTQVQLAVEAGIAKSTVQRLEAGAVATQLSGLIRVCRVLGLYAEQAQVTSHWRKQIQQNLRLKWQ